MIISVLFGLGLCLAGDAPPEEIYYFSGSPPSLEFREQRQSQFNPEPLARLIELIRFDTAMRETHAQLIAGMLRDIQRLAEISQANRDTVLAQAVLVEELAVEIDRLVELLATMQTLAHSEQQQLAAMAEALVKTTETMDQIQSSVREVSEARAVVGRLNAAITQVVVRIAAQTLAAALGPAEYKFRHDMRKLASPEEINFLIAKARLQIALDIMVETAPQERKAIAQAFAANTSAELNAIVLGSPEVNRILAAADSERIVLLAGGVAIDRGKERFGDGFFDRLKANVPEVKALDCILETSGAWLADTLTKCNDQPPPSEWITNQIISVRPSTPCEKEVQEAYAKKFKACLKQYNEEAKARRDAQNQNKDRAKDGPNRDGREPSPAPSDPKKPDKPKPDKPKPDKPKPDRPKPDRPGKRDPNIA